ncbi:hypothetical protein AAF712_012770 [Marasmius tenuissimus]|uniref:Uncharacterized protein n=1 Tax=Marasmius tenuissimus TaxID=585030 RepID=A0ABR2ZGM3_9AGAR
MVSRRKNEGQPTLPNINVGGPEMGQFEDDGMGGRLAGTTVGGGVVSPYPLFQGSAQPSPHHSQTAFNQYGNVPPSSQSHSAGYGTDTTQSPTSTTAFAAAGAGAGAMGGMGSASTSSGGTGHGVMSPARMAKEREAFGGGGFMGGGMPVPQHQQYQPHHTGSVYSQSEYSQPGGGGGSSQQHGGRFNIVNPEYNRSDSDGGPLPNPHSQRGGGVRVAQDAGAVGDEEIPPTYDSLVSGGGSRERPPEKGGLRVRNEDGDGHVAGGSGGGGASGGGGGGGGHVGAGGVAGGSGGDASGGGGGGGGE